MDKLNVTIDNVKVQVDAGTTILDAAKKAGIDIPTLCYMRELNEIGACRVCLVEVEGARGLAASCMQPVTENMVVSTATKKVRDARKSTLELILSDHNRDCLTCYRNRNCELQDLAQEFGVSEITFEGERGGEFTVDNTSDSIVRDQSKCILCGRCVKMCKAQDVAVLDFTNRGIQTTVSTAFDMEIKDVPCVSCGQCINVCPVAALKEKDDVEKVWAALEDNTKHVIVQTAPAIRAALGEEFGYPIGTRVTGKMVAALKRLGFDRVYDTNFGADLTIMEEGHELLDRLQNGGVLPMITSCSPGWVTFCEYNYPEFLENLSSSKSPHQMVGAIAKTYYAQKNNINPKDIVVVSVMPCIAKKVEANREELSVDGNADVDIVITTRELAKMIKQARIEFTALSDDVFHTDLMGEYTGSGTIFGVTGGVTEAAIRTLVDVTTGEELEKLEYTQVRGFDGIKEASVKILNQEIKIAVVHGLANASKLLKQIKNGEASYHFIEVMACSGGCINGGGQPIVPSKIRNEIDVREKRARVLYEEDREKAIRKSHKNPQIQKLYDEFLGKPNSDKAHEILHTSYRGKEKYPMAVEVEL